jgi:hypothetical protein
MVDEANYRRAVDLVATAEEIAARGSPEGA